MRLIIVCVMLLILSVIGSIYFKLGGYKSVRIDEVDEGPEKVVSKHHVGAYHTIVPVIEEVEKWAKSNQEECRFSFGEYIDDVDLVAEDRLQSNGGCLVARAWVTGLPEGFEYREIPRAHYVRAEFDGAPSIGPIKVYPKVKSYIEQHGLKRTGPVLEVYEVLSSNAVRTTYLFPVAQK